MKPPAVAVDFGAGDPDTPFGFEEVPPYPSHNSSPQSQQYWSQHQHQHQYSREEELPLHYSSMSEEKARRRVKPSGLAGDFDSSHEKEVYYDDDQGKDVYSKMRPVSSRLGSGRLPPQHLPPPTSLVSPAVLSYNITHIMLISPSFLSKA